MELCLAARSRPPWEEEAEEETELEEEAGVGVGVACPDCAGLDVPLVMEFVAWVLSLFWRQMSLWKVMELMAGRASSDRSLLAYMCCACFIGRVSMECTMLLRVGPWTLPGSRQSPRSFKKQLTICRPLPLRPRFLHRQRRALERLRLAVAEFPREGRREALEAVPPRARMALLTFMERCRALGQPEPRAKPRSRKQSRVGRKSVSWRPCVGLSRKKGGWIAKLCVSPNLIVSSRCFQTPEHAGQMMKVLLRARELAAPATCEENGQLLKRALVDACHEKGLELEDLAPSFQALVGAAGLVGCSVSSKSSTCLDEAIHHRSLLLAGRAAGWSHFREAWLQVLQASVQRRTSRAWGRARSKPLKRESAEELVEQTRRRFELVSRESGLQRWQQARQKRLARAARAVEAVLQQEQDFASKRARTLALPAASSRQSQSSHTGDSARCSHVTLEDE